MIVLPHFLCLFFLMAATLVHAVDLPEGVKVGDIAPDFTLVNVNNQTVGLKSYTDAKGIIVVFTCNHCPYSMKYEERIKQLHKEFSVLGYPVVAINPNDSVKVPEDSFSKMQQRASDKQFLFPYLVDGSQTVAKAYGARRTPHVFVLQKQRNGFVVEYIGAIDENADDELDPGTTFVVNAVRALLNGEKPQSQMTKAIGCTIKWK
jgi:peroxiredoxin